jgi:hypothetical protein
MTARKEAKSAVRSGDGVRGDHHCLEGGIGLADSWEDSITQLGVHWKDHRQIHPVTGHFMNL